MTYSEIIKLMLEDLNRGAAARHNTLGVPTFQTGMKRLGVSSPQIKSIANNWSSILFDYTSHQWIDLCIMLVQEEIFEGQILAYELLWKNKKALKSLNIKQILALGNKLDNWVSVDSYSTMIAGWHWREGTLPDSQIKLWLKSEDYWLRRVAVVSTIPLNLRSKGGTGDAARTLMVCENLIDDRNDLVVKAVSWALRELSKINGLVVEDFIEKYKNRLHPRICREVMAKIETGRKNG